MGGDTASNSLLFGLIVAVTVIIVIAAMFITVEYRRGLIRTTFTSTPRRGRVLAAKGVVIGAVAFVVGAIAAAVGIPLGVARRSDTNGNYVFPTGTLTVARIIAGSGALVAVTAVAVLALGTILRKSAGAVTAGIVVFLLPYILGPGGSFLSGGARELAVPPHPRRRLLRPRSFPAIRARQLPLHLRKRLLPARSLGRLRRSLRLRRACPRGGRVLAAPERRVTDAIHAEWTKLRTLDSTGWLLIGTVVSPDDRGQRRRRRRHPASDGPATPPATTRPSSR